MDFSYDIFAGSDRGARRDAYETMGEMWFVELVGARGCGFLQWTTISSGRSLT